ncbi:MAG TPA: hypothetical protein VH351_11740 [Bryobacteraceae bacterium]|jgi:hypothetical protein|nr:hypothetical protein [Bryobacteraceae bacterium]
MRRESDDFGDLELSLLYMASRLSDAQRLEKLLTDNDVDYLVETGTYTGGLLFARELTGAFFYVAPADLENTRQLLVANRYKPYDGR